MNAGNRQSRWFRAPWEFVLVAIIWLYIFPYSTSLNNPNERTRVLQARALVQFGQLHIGEAKRDRWNRIQYFDLYGGSHYGPFVNDTSVTCQSAKEKPPRCAGKIYPAKGPGIALLGVPALAFARWIGFVPDGLKYESKATWVLRYGGVGFLMLLALFVFSLLLREGGVPRHYRRRLVLATALGTSIFPYGISFVGHAMAGGVIVIGFYLLNESRKRGGWSGFALAILGGHSVAWAELMEYHAVAAIAVVSLWVLLSRARWRLLPGYVIGSGAAMALFMWLHNTMFGHPLKTGHFGLLTEHNRALQSTGFLGANGFYWKAIATNLFDPYMGIFFLMPWILVGLLVGLPLLLRRKQGNLPIGLTRAIALVPVAYLLFIATFEKWQSMNGWSYGPRFLTPTMMCMACTASFGWYYLVRYHRNWHRWFAGLMVASVVITAGVTMIYPSPPDRLRNPFGEMVIPLLSQGYSSRNLLMSWGVLSLILFGAFILVACLWIGRNPQDPLAHGRKRRWYLHIVRWSWLVIALTWTLTMGRVKILDDYWQKHVTNFCIQTLEGIAPREENPFFDKN